LTVHGCVENYEKIVIGLCKITQDHFGMEQGFSSLFAASVIKHQEIKVQKCVSYLNNIIQCRTENNEEQTLNSESALHEQRLG